MNRSTLLDVAPVDRALLGEAEVALAVGLDDLVYVWDDVAGALDSDLVTDVHPEVGDLVLVVEAGT